MARGFDPNAWQSHLRADEEANASSVSSLMRAMMGIQARKEAKARQEMLDRIDEEDRQRKIKQEELDNQIRMAKIQQDLAALQPRPTETKSKEIQVPAGFSPADQSVIADMPETAAESAQQIQASAASELPVTVDETVPAPRQTVRIGDLEIPLQYREDVQGRGDEDFARKLEQERQLQAVKGEDDMFTFPTDPGYGKLGGLSVPRTQVGSALAALARGERPGVKRRMMLDGAETLMTDEEIQDAQNAGQKVTGYTAPGDPSGMSPRQSVMYMGLTNKYSESPAIKQAQAGIAANMIADQVIADPGNATNQLKSMYQFIKNLDYNSAVREGETALVQMTQGYWDKWGMILDRVANKGVVVTPEVAVNLAKASKDLVRAWNAQAANREQMMRAQAAPAGISSQIDDFLAGFDRPWAGGSSPDNPVKVSSPEEAAKLAPGTYFQTPGGKIRKR